MTLIKPPSDPLPIALSLAKLGWHVHPVEFHEEGTGPPHPKTGLPQDRHFRTFWQGAASADPEQVATWWSMHPHAFIGIHTGRSGLLVVDLDKKHGKDGKAAVEARGLPLPKTFRYRSRTGKGQHRYYSAPSAVELAPDSDHEVDGKKLLGVDIRAGVGTIFYYGPELKSRPELAPAPKWALKIRTTDASDKGRDWQGGLKEWMDAFQPGPIPLALQEIVDQFTPEGMGRAEMMSLQNDLARVAANSSVGGAEAVRQAKATYLERYPKFESQWDELMLGAVKYWGPPFTEIKFESDEDGAPSFGDGFTVTQSPDAFFDKGDKIKARVLGEAVNPGDLAVGGDGQIWVYKDGVYIQDDGAIQNRTYALLDDKYRTNFTTLATHAVQSTPGVTRLSDEPHQGLINVKNGMYEWSSGKLHPHSPKYASLTQLDVSFDDDATCPHFDAWLAETVDEDTALIVWELIAYSMLNGNPFQKAALLMGPGRTGKGTLLRLLGKMAGDRNVSNVSLINMSSTFEPALMYGKLLNIVGDLEGTFLPDTAAFKRITGGDTINAQHKNQKPFSFRPWAFPVFGTNSVSPSADTTSGYFRRWLVIPFTHQFSPSKPFDERMLHQEVDGIFAKAMRILPSLMAAGVFTETVSSMEVLKQFELETDSVRRWLSDDDRVVQHDPSNRDIKADRATINKAYIDWCEDERIKNPMGRNKLFGRLRSIGHADWKSPSGGRYMLGLELNIHSPMEKIERGLPEYLTD